jgi:hypothetical protein
MGSQGDNGTAKPSPSEAGAVDPRCGNEVLDHRVQARGGHLEVSPHALVALHHELARTLGVAGQQCISERSNPDDLSHNVPGSTAGHGVGDASDLGKETERSDLFGGAAALSQPLLVGGPCHRPPFARINDQDINVFGNGYQVDAGVVAINQQGVIGDPGSRYQLVHDPARHAHGLVLGLLAQLCQLERRAFEPEGQSDGQLQRCTRRESGADREGRRDVPDEPLGRLLQIDDGGDVPTPLGPRGQRAFGPQPQTPGSIRHILHRRFEDDGRFDPYVRTQRVGHVALSMCHFDEMGNPFAAWPWSHPDGGRQHDGRESGGQIVLGHRAFALIHITSDIDAGTGGDGQKAQELTRGGCEDQELLRVQERRIASEGGVGRESQADLGGVRFGIVGAAEGVVPRTGRTRPVAAYVVVMRSVSLLPRGHGQTVDAWPLATCAKGRSSDPGGARRIAFAL